MSETYYADSSALVKRHISEIGSAWIEQEFDAAGGNRIITAKLSVAEVLSAMNRRRREANITATEYAKFSGGFLSFVETDYEMVELSDMLRSNLTTNHGLEILGCLLLLEIFVVVLNGEFFL
jgi:predicted nucleic acid-binding protein